MTKLYERIVNRELLVRRINVTANHVLREQELPKREQGGEQMDMFTDYGALEQERRRKEEQLEKEKRRQRTVIDIKKKYGKNAILRGMNLEEGATAKERNRQIGGHKA